jgi:3-hydroxybutyryl-CoA dehydrogenase
MSMADSPLAEGALPGAVAVIGGGRMGHAIAQIFVSVGCRVAVVEPDAKIRDQVRERVAHVCRVRGDDPAVAANVALHEKLEDGVAGADFVVEAAPERLELKRQIFARLEGAVRDDTILATNSSAIPPGPIAEGMRVPGRIVGTHFWNPPYAVRLVEVVQGARTSLDTIQRTMTWLKSAGQQPVHCKKDIPGFIGNRLQHALKREAIALVQAGVADAETVDFVVKNSFGQRLAVLGPLEQSDLIGLDLTLNIHETLIPDLDRSDRPQQLLVDHVKNGHLGAKSGEGFRKWTQEERLELEARLDRALAEMAKRR